MRSIWAFNLLSVYLKRKRKWFFSVGEQIYRGGLSRRRSRMGRSPHYASVPTYGICRRHRGRPRRAYSIAVLARWIAPGERARTWVGGVAPGAREPVASRKGAPASRSNPGHPARACRRITLATICSWVAHGSWQWLRDGGELNLIYLSWNFLD